MRPSGIGGQAVMEGVMMKNKSEYATAVRKPNNEIVVEKSTFHSISEKSAFFRMPIIRGVVAFVESMVLGFKTLTFSASFFEEEEQEKPSKFEETFQKIFKGKAEAIMMTISMILVFAVAVGIFILLPLVAYQLLENVIEANWLRALIEGLIRIAIFVGYVTAISQMKDIKRTFMYHGAEHKTINCIEHGDALTVENVKKHSKHHKRCGTSFMLIVMFVSIIFFIFIRVDTVWLRALVRILLIPVISGVSYEFIRLAGRSESKIVDILSRPGMWLQGLTTKEPEDDMIEVAIKSVEAVFDWKAYLAKEGVVAEFATTSEKENKKERKGKAKITEVTTEISAEVSEEVAVMKEDYKILENDEYQKQEESFDEIDEEEDEILKALDKYFVYKEKE